MVEANPSFTVRALPGLGEDEQGIASVVCGVPLNAQMSLHFPYAELEPLASALEKAGETVELLKQGLDLVPDVIPEDFI